MSESILPMHTPVDAPCQTCLSNDGDQGELVHCERCGVTFCRRCRSRATAAIATCPSCNDRDPD